MIKRSIWKGAAKAALALMALSMAFIGSILIWQGTAHAGQPFTGKVVGIADGDTLTVLTDNTQHKIRLAEIDSPEKKQAFGERAKQSLSDLCFNAEAVVLPATIDRYGRTIARVRCGGIDASLHQVQLGLAWAYTKYLTDPAIAAAEQAARNAGAGLWADPGPTPPWLYRKGQK